MKTIVIAVEVPNDTDIFVMSEFIDFAGEIGGVEVGCDEVTIYESVEAFVSDVSVNPIV